MASKEGPPIEDKLLKLVKPAFFSTVRLVNFQRNTVWVVCLCSAQSIAAPVSFTPGQNGQAVGGASTAAPLTARSEAIRVRLHILRACVWIRLLEITGAARVPPVPLFNPVAKCIELAPLRDPISMYSYDPLVCCSRFEEKHRRRSMIRITKSSSNICRAVTGQCIWLVSAPPP